MQKSQFRRLLSFLKAGLSLISSTPIEELEPEERPLVNKRILFISLAALLISLVASIIAFLLVNLILFITNLAFYQRVSLDSVSPAENSLGVFVVLVPIVGGIVVGLLARYGSKAIRGHGIPEAMEQVLSKGSVIPARLTVLKPISAAISIGTGGPFGAEGPIIASGGAFGSLVGQLFKTTAQERKTLLASGAAAGMTAIFGTPVAAVILAIELLVFEYRPRSFLPIAIAAAFAGSLRLVLFGASTAFSMPEIGPPAMTGMAFYAVEGVILGGFSIYVTRLVYRIEDLFEKLPIHWMWWPTIGGLVIGVIGYFSPDTLGVGYYNIDRILSTEEPASVAAFFCLMKLCSWSISLGSGTSGGTLAPLFTIGGGVGLVYGSALNSWFPGSVDVSVCALVGMAAIFAGTSRALLASTIFAFEATHQPWALLPLLAGSSVAYAVSSLKMKNSIMTEKISRRGVLVPTEYEADPLGQMMVESVLSKNVVTFLHNESIGSIRKKLDSSDVSFSHQGYPVVDEQGDVLGVFTRKDLDMSDEMADGPISEIISKPVVTISSTASVERARDMMVRFDIGRLVVVEPGTAKLVGIITRSDLFRAYSVHLNSELNNEKTLVTKRDKKRTSAAV